jgi:hypothetical protein
VKSRCYANAVCSPDPRSMSEMAIFRQLLAQRAVKFIASIDLPEY